MLLPTGVLSELYGDCTGYFIGTMQLNIEITRLGSGFMICPASPILICSSSTLALVLQPRKNQYLISWGTYRNARTFVGFRARISQRILQSRCTKITKY